MKKLKIYAIALLCVIFLFGCGKNNSEIIVDIGPADLSYINNEEEIGGDKDTNTPSDSFHDSEKTSLLLKEYISVFDENEIVYSDLHDNGNLYAVVARILPTYFPSYEKYGRSFYKGYYYVLHIGRYNYDTEFWENMDPIFLKDYNDDVWSDIKDIKIEKKDSGIYQFIWNNQLIYTLLFSDDNFSLERPDSFYSSYGTVPDIDCGLLLGMEEEQSIKSYFMYEENGEFKIIKKSDGLIVPTNGGFYNVANFQYYVTDLMVHEIYGRESYTVFNDYFSYAFTEDGFKSSANRRKDYDNYFSSYGYDQSNDEISFITNGFISFHNSYYWDYGGSGKSTTPTAFFYEVNAMNEQRFREGDMRVISTGKNLVEQIPEYKNEINRKIENLRKEYDVLNVKIAEEEGRRDITTYHISDQNLLLIHEEGELKLKLAVACYSYTPNYSPHGHFSHYIDMGIDLSDKFGTGNRLCISFDEIKEWMPTAMDAFSSPNGKVLIVDTEDDVAIYIREDTESNFSYFQPVYSIQKKDGDRIVMSEWAMGEWVNKWKEDIWDIKTCQIYNIGS